MKTQIKDGYCKQNHKVINGLVRDQSNGKCRNKNNSKESNWPSKIGKDEEIEGKPSVFNISVVSMQPLHDYN